MNAENEGAKPYPYNLEAYLKPKDMVSLDFYGPDITFDGIFGQDVPTMLGSCRQRVESSLERAKTYLGATFPPAEKFTKAIDDLCSCFSAPVTFRYLMEAPRSDWPANVEERANALVELGFYLNFPLIPDNDKAGIASYFSPEGDDFLGKEGQLALSDYFGLPRSAYSQERLDLLFRGRRLGVLICHAEAFAADAGKDEMCWDGFDCQDTSLNLVCTGDSGSSDPCP